jgi:hypothetical protein
MTTLPPTTAAPTTVAPTTVAPTTGVPTTTLTTIVPTTVPPTPAPIDIDPEPIEVRVSLYSILHYNPPMPVNPGLNQEADFGPIEITVSIEGYNQNLGFPASAIPINVSIHGNLVIGISIPSSPIIIPISIISGGAFLEQVRRNFVKWSKIGVLDFTIDESNVAGERPVDWSGYIWHLGKLGSQILAYGENGVSSFKASGVNWGMDTIYPLGLKNKGAYAGDENMHFFVDKLGYLVMVTDSIQRLDYSEFIDPMGTVILTLDTKRRLLYICDGSVGYIFGIESKSFGVGPVNITGLGEKFGNLYVASSNIIETPVFEICTDVYDFGIRRPKIINQIEVGTDVTENLYVTLDYRTSYKHQFRRMPQWHLVNPDGKAFPRCYGVEFRFRLKSTMYEYLELDYFKIRGHIHSFMFLDSYVSGKEIDN